MNASRCFISIAASLLLFVAGTGPALGAISSVPSTSSSSLDISASSNSLDIQEFHVRNARLPGIVSARQNVTAWHVTQGSWNGQPLNGLFIVLVRTAAEDGTSGRSTSCYVSHEATAAQRDALVEAFLAGNSQISNEEIAHLRIEPGVISIEIAGQTVVLHLGLIA